MKKIKHSKLKINRETMRILKDSDLGQARGGYTIIALTAACSVGCTPYTEGCVA